MNQKFWQIACGFLTILLVSGLFLGTQKLNQLQVKEQKKETEITKKQTKADELKSRFEFLDSAPTSLSPEEQTEVSNSAAELGNQVASYQNVYQTISAAENREAFDANANALDGCFDESSKSARVPWYQGKVIGEWKFITDGTFRGNTKEVLWLCENSETGELLAYATAVYDAEQKLFMNVDYELTMNASNAADSTGEETKVPIDVNEVNDLSKDLQDQTSEDTSSEESNTTDDVKDAQQKLKDALTGGDKS